MEIKQEFIKYFFAIIIILAIVFFSRQLYSTEAGKNLISDATSQAGAYLAKGSDWITTSVFPKITVEVQSRGDTIKTKVIQTKEKITENILDKTKNYLTGITNSILHPGENNNCPTTAPAQ